METLIFRLALSKNKKITILQPTYVTNLKQLFANETMADVVAPRIFRFKQTAIPTLEDLLITESNDVLNSQIKEFHGFIQKFDVIALLKLTLLERKTNRQQIFKHIGEGGYHTSNRGKRYLCSRYGPPTKSVEED